MPLAECRALKLSKSLLLWILSFVLLFVFMACSGSRRWFDSGEIIGRAREALLREGYSEDRLGPLRIASYHSLGSGKWVVSGQRANPEDNVLSVLVIGLTGPTEVLCTDCFRGHKTRVPDLVVSNEILALDLARLSTSEKVYTEATLRDGIWYVVGTAPTLKIDATSGALLDTKGLLQTHSAAHLWASALLAELYSISKDDLIVVAKASKNRWQAREVRSKCLRGECSQNGDPTQKVLRHPDEEAFFMEFSGENAWALRTQPLPAPPLRRYSPTGGGAYIEFSADDGRVLGAIGYR